MKFRTGKERRLTCFTSLAFLFYDFYLFTLVMICYIAFYGLYGLKFFWPAKAYQAILFQIGDFFGRNFTSRREGFRMKWRSEEDG
ncbi:MAG: hypothetical protein ACMUIA_02035 [bacterium]